MWWCWLCFGRLFVCSGRWPLHARTNSSCYVLHFQPAVFLHGVSQTQKRVAKQHCLCRRRREEANAPNFTRFRGIFPRTGGTGDAHSSRTHTPRRSLNDRRRSGVLSAPFLFLGNEGANVLQVSSGSVSKATSSDDNAFLGLLKAQEVFPNTLRRL